VHAQCARREGRQAFRFRHLRRRFPVFSEKGLAIDRRWVELREPIRTTGEFVGSVRLHPQVRASFKIQVNPIA